MGSRLKGKKPKQEEQIGSQRMVKLIIYAVVILLAVALIWYYYFGY